MQHIQRIHSEETIKILGDSTRLAILRLLISHPATISQLGEILGKHPAQIRHHIMQLEKVGVVELESIKTVKNYQEKYYQATARSYFLSMSILPVIPESGMIVILGSDDPALDLLANQLSEKTDAPHLYIIPVGSLNGLVDLRDKYCQISGCHLFDIDSEEYNLPYVRQLFTEQTMILVTLSHRQQGLIIQKGNPKYISGVTDLIREDITFINRKRGSGTRLWLDQNFRRMGIEKHMVKGYRKEASSHSEVAGEIASGTVDVGLGLFTAAQKFQLDFIPLFMERYDLVMREEMFLSHTFMPILETIQSPEFKQQVESLGGYDTSHTGDIITV
jgi:molybdate-binding protein/DNA-binding transcriptional ArsR family regulator